VRILYLAFVELDVPNACRTHTLEVIRNLAMLGHRLVAILPRPKSSIHFPDGVEVSYVYPWTFSWYGKLVFHLLAAGRLCYYFVCFRPDVVYEREISGNPLPAFLCRLFRIHLFVEINGVLLDYLARYKASKFRIAYERCLQSWELHTATGLVSPSDHLRIRFMQEYDLPHEHCAFILSGFDPDTFSPGDRHAARVNLALPEEVFALIFVGTLWYAYDLQPYFRVLRHLKENSPNLVMWIIGDGPMRKTWETETKVLGLEAKVRFVGYQPEVLVAEWIRAANLCLVPLSAEGLAEHGALSTKIWAYAGCARAILLHNDPKQPFPHELLPFVRLVPPEDVQVIESEIKRAMTDPYALDRQGEAISSWVHQHATWAHTVKRTIDFMQKRIH